MGGGHPKGEWVNSAITQQSLHKNLVFMRGKKKSKKIGCSLLTYLTKNATPTSFWTGSTTAHDARRAALSASVNVTSSILMSLEELLVSLLTMAPIPLNFFSRGSV